MMGEAKLKQKLLGSVRLHDPSRDNIQISLNRIGDKVMIDFGKNVQWISFSVEQAVEFAHKVIEQAMGMKCSVHVSPLEFDESFNPTPSQDQPQQPPSDDQGK